MTMPEARHSSTRRSASPAPIGRFAVPMDFSHSSSRGCKGRREVRAGREGRRSLERDLGEHPREGTLEKGAQEGDTRKWTLGKGAWERDPRRDPGKGIWEKGPKKEILARDSEKRTPGKGSLERDSKKGLQGRDPSGSSFRFPKEERSQAVEVVNG